MAHSNRSEDISKEKAKKHYCTNCGKLLKPHWNNCPYCSVKIRKDLWKDKLTYCQHCREKIDDLPFTCNYCGRTFCKKHRLPEKHECTFELNKKIQVESQIENIDILKSKKKDKLEFEDELIQVRRKDEIKSLSSQATPIKKEKSIIHKPQINLCPFCGYENELNKKYCHQCGYIFKGH
jgi:hypothetical protein